MTWAVAAVAGATVVGSYLQSQGAQNAANTQANAALQQQGNLLQAGQQASQQFAPYANYGTGTALPSLVSNNPYFNQQFSNADLNANLAPNYAFMLGQGQQANMMASNATGGAVSGNTLKSLQDYTQNYASNAYQNAFNNFQTQRGNIAAIDLANANLGLSGSTGSANAQLGTATNVANLGIGSANAQAANQIAQGQIYGGAANTLGNLAYMGFNNQNSQQGLLNNMGGYSANDIATGASPGGSFTPTAGNSFQVS